MEQSDKSLTIHLYRRDEVLASLRWAIITNNYTETAFWGLELYDSNMEEDVLSMLTRLWFTEIGFGSFKSLEKIRDLDLTDRDSWVGYLISAWTRVKVHDSTAFHLLIRGASEPTSWTPSFAHSKEYTSIAEAFEDCLSRGKIEEAWLLARALEPAQQWLILEKLAAALQRSRELHVLRTILGDCEARAAAHVLVTLDETMWLAAMKDLDMRELPVELGTAIDSWDNEDSSRKRRVFKIRPEAILFITDRSSQPVNISCQTDIMDSLLENLRASTYWSAVLENFMAGEKWLSEDSKEDFYDTFFPNDIPDEWSEADREKSHGRGLGRNYAAGQQRFLDTLFQKSMTLGIWQRKPIKVDFDSEMEIQQYYENNHLKCKETLDTLMPMKPVKKTFDII
jgi:hypothetical protein